VNLFNFYGIFVPVLSCSCFTIFISPADLGDSLVIMFQFCFAIEIWFSGPTSYRRQRGDQGSVFLGWTWAPCSKFSFSHPWVQCCSCSSQFQLWVPVPNSLSAGLSYPVPRKRERSLHTCAQDVQITRTITI
jgi:hypothetical protein